MISAHTTGVQLGARELGAREHGGCLIVTLRGELDAAGAQAAGAALAAAAASNPRLVLDLTMLEYIDCCSLSMLARLRAQAQRGGGDLLLAAPGPLVWRVLVLAAMTASFAVHASVGEAMLASGWASCGTRAPALFSGLALSRVACAHRVRWQARSAACARA